MKDHFDKARAIAQNAGVVERFAGDFKGEIERWLDALEAGTVPPEPLEIRLPCIVDDDAAILSMTAYKKLDAECRAANYLLHLDRSPLPDGGPRLSLRIDMRYPYGWKPSNQPPFFSP